MYCSQYHDFNVINVLKMSNEMTNICRLVPDGKYAGNINQKYMLFLQISCTALYHVLAKLVVIMYHFYLSWKTYVAFRLLNMSFIYQMAPKNMCWLLEKNI